MTYNKCNEILLTVTTGLFLLGLFVGGFDQDAAILRRTLFGRVISLLLQGCSFILIVYNVNCIYRHVKYVQYFKMLCKQNVTFWSLWLQESLGIH